MSEPWLPQPGPQTLAYNSQADELYYGGAAGGGKTDLLVGVAATSQHRSIIFRRETTQAKGVEERLMELLVDGQFPNKARGLYNKQDKEYWSHERGGYKIFLGGVKDAGDEKKWQGRPHDFKGFDELPTFTQYQYQFLNTWKRSTKPGQRTRTIGAGNPPTDDDGMWVIDYWAPWIDPNYLGKRALVGELRWYITDLDKNRTYEVESDHSVTFKGRTYSPKSRTFIPSQVRDNMYFDGSGYESQLSMLPEPLRSKFLMGDFSAGVQEDQYQLIPGQWIEMSFARWREKSKPDIPITQLGVDVARGGKDEFIVAPRYGNRIETLFTVPAAIAKDGVAAARAVAAVMVHRSTVAAVDLLGVGTSVVDHLQLLRPGKVIPMNASEGVPGLTDASGLLTFMNARALWYWRLRELLDPLNPDCIDLPPDPELKRELTAVRWKPNKAGIQIESKDDIKARLGRSPDKADAVVYAVNDQAGSGMGLFRFYQAGHEELKYEREQAKKDEKPVIIIGSTTKLAPKPIGVEVFRPKEK